MSITFHCEYCGKKIQAPDDAGGKWGKCPSCRKKLYVPAPQIADDELKLAPIDENEEMKQKRLLAESYKLTQDILSQKEIPVEGDEVPRPAPEVSDKKLLKAIVVYLRQMADGELERAEKTAASIIPAGDKAIEILDQIAAGELAEPALADIPEQVLSSLIRDLQAQIG